jgi:TPR repeat protein
MNAVKRTLKAATVGLVLALSLAGPAAAGPLEDGMAAYDRGDYATALLLVRPLADQGNAGAQFKLGNMYHHGEGVPQDYAAALDWYRKAADKGEVEAQLQLGTMYFLGEGVPRDFAAAVSWYRKAADQGNVYGQYDLGKMYADGQGVPQDFVTAHMWFNLAAARGLRDAFRVRDLTAAEMTPAQIAEAQKLAREWKPKPEREPN